MAMTGGTSKLVLTDYALDSNGKPRSDFPVKLYVYYKTSTNSSTLKTTVTCGMYITTPSKSYPIGSWDDFGGSYVGTTSNTFDGYIPANTGGTYWIVENKSFTVSHNATTGKASATIYWKLGCRVYSSFLPAYREPSGSFTIDLPTITVYGNCNAPTSVKASPSPFEDNVKIEWSGASGGTNNTIKSYNIQYATSSNNSTWGNWTTLKNVSSTSSSGNYTVDLSSITRGYYVKFQVRTEGKAGDGYYSGYKESSAIQRIPYTRCSSPTTFTVSSNDANADGDFNTTVTFSWSGAIAGTNNSIKNYLIRYKTSSNNSSWSDWKDLQTVSNTTTSGSVSIDLSSKVERGYYVKFAIRTQGSAGDNYNSYFIYANSTNENNAKAFKRIAYTKCSSPTTFNITSESDVDGVQHNDIFNSSITLRWSGANGGTNNNISQYLIRYRTSENNSNWSLYSDLATSTNTSYTVNLSSLVTRGYYVQFAIMAKGSAGSSYNSDWKYSSVIKRNSVPIAPTKLEVASPISLEYSNGDSIVLNWGKSVDNDSNLKYYQLQARTTTKGVWGSWINVDNQIGSSTLSYTILPTLDLYTQVANDEKIQFRIRGYDNFGEVSSYISSGIVVRYDITGVAIGINDKWVNCQIYVGINGSWVEQDVYAGINNHWVETNKE